MSRFDQSQRNLPNFLIELKALSRKYGIWIDANASDHIALINDDCDAVAAEFDFNTGTEDYTAKKI